VEETGEGATSATLGLPADRPPLRDPEAGRDTLRLEGGRIAQYELIRPLGRGGMGAVHLARDTRLGRLVAIKIVRDRELISAERFRVEARATARCVHENIVVIHDIGEHAGHLYLALEYLSGVTLKQWLEARRARAEASPLPLDRAVQIALPVVRAMVCAHEHGIVHRDLKPSNIMMTDSGVIKVLDFGVAKLFGAGEPAGAEGATHSSPDSSDDGAAPAGRDLTEAGLQVGSGYYMSPEQRRADDVDHRADLWAVGMILYELCAGRHPLRGPAWRNLAEVADLDVPMPPRPSGRMSSYWAMRSPSRRRPSRPASGSRGGGRSAGKPRVALVAPSPVSSTRPSSCRR
jgi:serine/threonine protein kinase